MTAPAPARACPCLACATLDRTFPRDGVQLRLIAGSGGRAAPSLPHPDASTVAAADGAPTSGRPDMRSPRQSTGTGDSVPMNARAAIAKIALSAPPAKAAPAPPPRIVPSAPEPVALGTLDRAPENVRHVRIDEDVTGLADDIAAHGLLQSLIGYRDGHRVRIVGGGRRLQALHRLVEDGLIDARFRVPVLIRDAADALELSLAENLQQRTMSPVDEFFAFKALIDTRHHSPAGLAARFGFSERVVKQRLRLANLAPVILDALAARAITLDAAMAYAATQDRDLQAEIFAIEHRRGHDPHRLANIRHAVAAKGMKTDHPVMTFLGIEAYEAAGGGYEDSLFTDAADADRIVARPMLAQAKAIERIDAAMAELLADVRADPDFAPTVTGYVIAPGLRLHSWGNQDAKGPPGTSRVDEPDERRLWQRIRDTDIDVQLLVGIDSTGALKIHPRTVFVAKADRARITPPPATAPDHAAAQAEATRRAGIDLWAGRLSVGSFVGTPFEGRAYWPEPHRDHSHATSRDGIPGRFVHINIFVPDALAATKRKQAERRYDKWLAERAAPHPDRATRAQTLLAMDPPAAAIVAGDAWLRQPDGGYATEHDPATSYDSWAFLLDCHQPDEIGETFATLADFEAATLARAGADA